jgi:hypothetical protein
MRWSKRQQEKSLTTSEEAGLRLFLDSKITGAVRSFLTNSNLTPEQKSKVTVEKFVRQLEIPEEYVRNLELEDEEILPRIIQAMVKLPKEQRNISVMEFIKTLPNLREAL